MDILRIKFYKWHSYCYIKIKENSQKRIAKFIEERYKISKARKNWIKLSNLFTLHITRNKLAIIRARIKKIKWSEKVYNLIFNLVNSLNLIIYRIIFLDGLIIKIN